MTPEQEYAARTPASARHHDRLRLVVPNGLASDNRVLEPHPLAISRAEGARKQDIDGNEYVDYILGNGALILGHAPARVLDAVASQLRCGTHYGASHRAELAWAETVLRLYPAMDMVRFTSSGTEATLLALRLARAATGKRKIIRFRGHYHGWHDHLVFGFRGEFDGQAPPGILQGIADQMIVLKASDIESVKEVLRRDRDVAAVILEPTGGVFGQLPISPEFVRQLRAATEEHGVLLVFDEVLTGFRCAMGGAQALLRVAPDLTTLAKVPFGGFAGGAVAGRKAWLQSMIAEPGGFWSPRRIVHNGTFNGYPVATVAGLAAIEELATTSALEALDRRGAQLRAELNRIIARKRIRWVVYGEHSAFHVLPGVSGQTFSLEGIASGDMDIQPLLARVPHALTQRLRCALAVCGVDITSWRSGFLSTAHGDREIDHTLAAFDRALDMVVG